MGSFDDILDNSPDITPEMVESYLSTVEYPLSKQDLLYWARMNKATTGILQVLEQIDEGVYHSYKELDFYVRRALGYATS